jgi:hypothetical protein
MSITHNIFCILQHDLDWRCNMDYSPLWSAFKMKTKNIRITSTCTRYHCFLEISYRYIHSLIKYVDIVNAELIESTTFLWIWGLTGISFARRKSITIASKIYLRLFFTFARITCYLEYIWFTHNIFCILQQLHVAILLFHYFF